MENKEIFELADKLKELRERKSETDLQLKGINAEIESVEGEMINVMAEEELQSFKRAGSMFSLTVSEYPSAVPETRDTLYEVLKEKGYGHLFTINSRTLSSNVKEIIEENEGELPEWLEGLIKIYEKSSITVRKAK